MSELSRTDVEDIVKKILNETLDKKNEELVQKIRIFVDMTLNKILETKLRTLLQQLNSGFSEGASSSSDHLSELNSTVSEVLRELNAVSESCNELLDKIDSLELRLEEPQYSTSSDIFRNHNQLRLSGILQEHSDYMEDNDCEITVIIFSKLQC